MNNPKNIGFGLVLSTVLCLGAAAHIRPAHAADLGGNCCTDLEERIAELESTTARKGNRKVSLKISGFVHEAVFFWDDGKEQNVYVGTNSLEQTRVKFKGKAKIAYGWYAGYKIELGVDGTPSKKFDQKDNGTGQAIITRKSYWFLKSKKHGKVSVGLNGGATYHLLNDANGVNTRYYSDAEAATIALAKFKIRQNGAYVNSLKWADLAQGKYNDTPGQSQRRNVIRYDSPSLAGFVVSASWGEDDMFDVALSYAGKHGDFALVGKVGYGQNSDSTTSACNTSAADLECEWWGAAGTILHVPTGLFVYAGYGEQEDDSEEAFNAAADGTDTTWFIQAGIEKQLTPLGITTIFGEYRQDEAGSNLSKFSGGANFIHNSDLDYWAVGIVQHVDAAAMDLYAIYRHSEGEFTDSVGTQFKLDDFDMFITGARIKF